MSGITIISAKVVGICSKCRKEGDEIPRNKDGSIIPDKDISCINAALGESPCQEKVGEDEFLGSSPLTKRELYELGKEHERERVVEILKNTPNLEKNYNILMNAVCTKGEQK